MNQRVVLIVLVAVFVTCFVGSCAVGTLKLVQAATSGLKDAAQPRPFDEPQDTGADQPFESKAPPQTQPAPLPELDETPDEDDFVPEYEPPTEGVAQFAVFHVSKPKVDPWAALQKAAKAARVTAYKGEAPEEAEPPFIVLSELTTSDYEVITGSTLDEGKGLSPADKAALPKAKVASVFDVTVPTGVSGMQDVSKLLGAFTAATGGVLWDEEAQQYLSAEAWQARRVKSWSNGVPAVPLHVAVFVTPVEGGVNLRSAGLRHFGQPELELHGVPEASSELAVQLVNAIAQLLVEGPEVAQPGVMTVNLEAIKHPEQRKALLEQCGAGAQKRIDVDLSPGRIPGDATLVITAEPDAVTVLFGE